MSKNVSKNQAQYSPAGASSELTPDGQVAQRIVEQLVADGLIDATQADSVRLGLAGGAARNADWRFIAQTAIDEEVRNAANAD